MIRVHQKLSLFVTTLAIMFKQLIYLLFAGLIFMSYDTVAQSEGSLHKVRVPSTSDTLIVDSLTIYDQSFEVYCNGQRISNSSYYLNPLSRKFVFFGNCSDSLTLYFRVFPIDFDRMYQSRDTSLIYNQKGSKDDFLYTLDIPKEDFFGGSSIQKSGSISRGVSFGNSQDLSVNSSLNLQLSGEVSPNMKILATVTDDNIPIQPDGNTNRLQEFDQVFIQLYGDQYKIIAGDFWLRQPKGHFMNYNKRAQGLYAQHNWKDESGNSWSVQGAGALSKGKFGRNVIQGVEGNQGPYRLRGNDNEPFIIVLGGTENVYLDGRLLERGQEYDYTINYNTSEVIFTTRNLITKDVRIVVEFQYTEQNYARSLFQSSATFEGDKFDFWMNLYSEQDAKNQTLQQDISLKDRQLLMDIGDSVHLARTISIDSIGFTDRQVTYKMIDSLGFDSILVYSVVPDSAFYRAVFSRVGQGRGNYIFDRNVAVGRVYKWVAPIGGIPQGEYEPIRLIVTPKRNSMITSGFNYRFNERLVLSSELSYSHNDINTFSSRDNDNNNAFANNTKLIGTFDLGGDSISRWKFITSNEIEFRTRSFTPIERYRSVEFDRDWNVRGRDYSGDELLVNLGGTFRNSKFGHLGVEGQNFTLGNDFQGNRARIHGDWNKNGFRAKWDGSYLRSNAEALNNYTRHIADVSKELKWFKIGFKDDHELNTFNQGDSLLTRNSYQWYDWQIYAKQKDSATNGFQLFYRERYDRISDSSALAFAAVAKSFGAGYDWLSSPHSKLSALVSYRSLEIKNTSLINQIPENTLLGRLDYNLKVFKGALTANTFYEVGSGLELRKEFLYIRVNTGQGVYTWIDYNGDGIQDLNEFEIAQFPDQANYIRVFTPSDDYVRTFSNEFNQTLFWRPERIWAKEKGVKKFLARFSNQTRFRISRKTSEQGFSNYIPFIQDVADTSLISYASTVRNTLFFNRTNSIFGGDYTFSEVGSKVLLANGFDARQINFHQLNLRWNIQKKFTLTNTAEFGKRNSSADYTTGRDFSIAYYKVQPSFIFQPNTKFRVSLDVRLEDKQNAENFGGELAEIRDFGALFKFNQAQQGSFQGGINMVRINYQGPENNALAFEMLEALRPGVNFTWNLSYQRSISQNLQISIQYNGRKSENNATIHAGGVEVRAFF